MSEKQLTQETIRAGNFFQQKVKEGDNITTAMHKVRNTYGIYIYGSLLESFNRVLN